jgi:hypothetical protein
VRPLRALTAPFIVVVIVLFIALGIATGSPPVVPALAIAAAAAGTIWLSRDRLPQWLRPRSAVDALGVFFVLLFVSAAVFDYTVNLPVASAERPRIATEFGAIAQPELTRRVSYQEITKSNSVIVDGTYQAAAATWADLRSHFDRVLGADGWSFLGDKGVKEWDQDYGGREACYGKGQDRAHVFFPGRVNAGYTYSFSIAWEIGRRPPCF